VPCDLQELDSPQKEEEREFDEKKEENRGFNLELEPLDHSTIKYAPFTKDFYVAHPNLVHVSSEEVQLRRSENRITVESLNQSLIPAPVMTFGELGPSIGGLLLHQLFKANFDCPTEIQSQAVPVALAGHDLIGLAKTGSGKTLAYVLPLIVHALDQNTIRQAEGPIALILSPTRELAQQIASEVRRFGKTSSLKVSVIIGGESKFLQFKDLRDGCAEVVVTTPGRFIDLLRMKACSLQRVTYCVIDEADRMLDMGFEPQVRTILMRIRPDRQLLLFSATFSPSIDRLARSFLSESFVKVIVGDVGSANDDVTQHFHVFHHKREKWEWLIGVLPDLMQKGAVVIFSSTKATCAELANDLRLAGHPTISIHGETDQRDREGMTRMFKSGELNLMVATDIFARGLDVKRIRSVISYDPPRSLDWYIHRIGRTGRGGTQGESHCLLTERDIWCETAF